ncbi:MAG: divalent-cation tolerance protein CutA [Candidatus Bathyarchaeia archaeon]
MRSKTRIFGGPASVVYTTVSSMDDAQKLANSLVEAHLAACATILENVHSVYRWKGTVENAKEFMIMIKTRRSLTSKVIKHLKQIHPYEVPEAISVSVIAGSEYLKWLEGVTQTVVHEKR